MTLVYPVDDPSRIAEVRRAAARMAQEEGLDEDLSANASLVATEICTNLLKHARQGEVFLSTKSEHAGAGIEMLSVDRGPGIADVASCLIDGYSSANTSGIGLGAVARRSTEFDVYSEPGKGTVLVTRILRSRAAATKVGAVLRPIHGEEVSGDAWAFSEQEGILTLIVADGLGHGVMAARASAEAISAFRRSSDRSPTVVLQKVHAAARATRGAAVAVAYVDRAAAIVRYAGIGNISGVLIGGGKPVLMISHNGTAGYHSPRFQEFSYALSEPAIVVMHSDGLHTNWNLDDHPGLRRRDPSVIAGVLYRDGTRNRDDVSVAVAKIGDAS